MKLQFSDFVICMFSCMLGCYTFIRTVLNRVMLPRFVRPTSAFCYNRSDFGVLCPIFITFTTCYKLISFSRWLLLEMLHGMMIKSVCYGRADVVMSECSICHVPYNESVLPFPIHLSRCAICGSVSARHSLSPSSLSPLLSSSSVHSLCLGYFLCVRLFSCVICMHVVVL